ncbi:hypothetical protein ckrop_2023 [Corynebacterium kroppenstedtii DSM 44385]|uniref:Uncharacterized protein n=1 Tax=Corynebacterium kroppenstedtii (strain DSM 44385 / JCM 11950 / CIP 105744 / CCUG 35717) TaxID=645127 RepID=C4LLM3_CORK4|nr:hypothetical protein ckrop_2023 [Corynebacterium kroppenstedtii DSM 44385]
MLGSELLKTTTALLKTKLRGETPVAESVTVASTMADDGCHVMTLTIA